MAMPDSLQERLFYTNKKEYIEQDGNIAYLDSRGLKRPFSMPRGQRIIVIVIVALAILIGYTIIDKTVLETQRNAVAFQEAVDSNLTRPASIETLPTMTQMINRDDDGIRNAMHDAGYSFFDASELTDSYNLLIYKVPSDMTVDEIAAMYATGIGSLDATQATKFLNGSWFLGVDREIGSMVVRYVDFTTGDPQVAVQNAIDKQGFDRESITDSGVDDSGNTYATGGVDAEGTWCTWKVSALPFDDMYSIRGFPENSCYVGVRLTVA